MLQIVGHVEGLNRIFVVTHIPNLDRNVIARKHVVVASWRKLDSGHRTDDFRKKVFLSGCAIRRLKLHATLSEGCRLASVNQSHITLTGGESENFWPLRVILHMSNDFSELLAVLWPQID